MTDREFFMHTIEDETPRFERLLLALPTEHLDYTPDAKSRSAIELARVLAAETEGFSDIISLGVWDVLKAASRESATPASAAENLVFFLGQTKELAEKISEEDWNGPAQMKAGDKVEWEASRGKMAWGLLLDLIHHRGQLSTYIRPMGGKLPSIYGPSADSN